MVAFQNLSFILLSLASGASAVQSNGLRGLLDFERKLSTCYEAPMCPNQMDACMVKDGETWWRVHDPASSTGCASKCVRASELVAALDSGLKCGECAKMKYCPAENICDVSTDKTKFNLYIKKDGKCERICVDDHKVQEHKAKGYLCQSCYGSCPKSNLCEKDSGKVKFTMHKKKDGKCESQCVEDKDVDKKMQEGFSCTPCESPTLPVTPNPDYKDPCVCEPDEYDGDIEVRRKLETCTCYGTEKKDPDLPTPEKCVLKRAGQMLRYEPNVPAQFAEAKGRHDVYIQVHIFHTNEYYEFVPLNFDASDYKTGDIDFNPLDIPRKWAAGFAALYQAQKDYGGQGFQLRYVSKNGYGDWNTCSFSPIALDLDKDGVVEKITGDFEIDIDGDGLIDSLNEWFGPNEGILIDMKGHTITSFSGTTISGQHLFGDMALDFDDGFEKLAQHDDNEDGFLSGVELDGFAIWKDANSNAILDDGELSTLASNGVVSLNTVEHETHKSTAVLNTAQTVLMEDLWFQR